jgi:HK97 family phage portal protein
MAIGGGVIKKLAGWFGYEKGAAMTERWYPVTAAMSKSNIQVTPDQALRLAAVLSCVRVLAETIAALPLHVYRRLPGGGKERAYDHPLYRLLHQRPNSWQTKFEFHEMLEGHIALRGNAYALKFFGRGGELTDLFPLHPDRMRIERLENGKLIYILRTQEGSEQRRVIVFC